MCTTENKSTTNKVNNLRVVRSHLLSAGIREIVVEMPRPKPQICAGQFYNLGIKDSAGPILKRPISVSKVSEEGIHFVIKVLGEGTKRLNNLRVNDEVLAVGPLGNGVSNQLVKDSDEVILIGGGIGVAPLLQLAIEAKAQAKKVVTILGYSEKPYLVEAFQNLSDELYLCIDPRLDASEVSDYGDCIHLRGTVAEGIKRIKEMFREAKTSLFACGPEVMLAGIQNDVLQLTEESYYMTEERMACGMGACLVCAKKIIQNDEIKMLRTCIEGPVFKAKEVVFE